MQKTITNEDLILYYLQYIEHLEQASLALDYMIAEMRDCIENTDNKEKDIDKEINDIEKLFFSVAHLPAKLNDLIDECYEIDVQKIIKDSNKKTMQDNIIMIPIFSDEDIYVDTNDTRIKDFWKRKD